MINFRQIKIMEEVVMEGPLEIGQIVRQKISGNISTIISIQGSWVQLYTKETKSTTFVPIWKIMRSYV